MNIENMNVENLLETYIRDEHWNNIKSDLLQYSQKLGSLELLLTPSITMEIKTFDDYFLSKKQIEVMTKSNITDIKDQYQNLVNIKYLLSLMKDFTRDKNMNVTEE